MEGKDLTKGVAGTITTIGNSLYGISICEKLISHFSYEMVIETCD